MFALSSSMSETLQVSWHYSVSILVTCTRKTLLDTAVFDGLQRWKNVPNRREPFTLEMLQMLHDMVVAGELP